MEAYEITRITGRKREKQTDWVTEEIPLTIDLNSKELVTLLSSPTDLKELVCGFLYSSGFIQTINDIKKLIIDEERGRATVVANAPDIVEELNFKRLYTSGCGRGTIYYNALDLSHRQEQPITYTIDSEKLIMIMKAFQRSSEEFRKTGGVHSAALCDRQGVLFQKEDIGRHNAVDKVIGAAISKNIDFDDKLVVSSGRISSEILLKVNRCKIAIIASASAPTNQAVKLAKELNITLIGFLRGNRMNIYSTEERIE